MPLSHEDRQKLAEIERELTRMDPDLARTITAGRFPLLRPILFGAAFVAAAAVLIGGLVTTHAFPITGIVIAIAGTATMVWAAGGLLREVRAMLPVLASTTPPWTPPTTPPTTPPAAGDPRRP